MTAHHRLHPADEPPRYGYAWRSVLTSVVVIAICWAIAGQLVAWGLTASVHGQVGPTAVCYTAAAIMALLALSWWPRKGRVR